MGILYIIGLSISALGVSILGAGFSISGLGRLFSGASLAVAFMAGFLEFSKFVLAAFLHRTWNQLNIIYRSYLFASVVILSVITSMGIFGFLSDAYQTSSTALNEAQIRIEALQGDQTRNAEEIARINRAIDEIPGTRISKKLQARKEAEPALLELAQKSDQIAKGIADLNLQILHVKNKVGPLIYVSRAFHIDIDTVVKYLILIFVSVFDPLAICLVIATSEASRMRASLPLLPIPRMTRAAPTQVTPAVAPHPVLHEVPRSAPPEPPHLVSRETPQSAPSESPPISANREAPQNSPAEAPPASPPADAPAPRVEQAPAGPPHLSIVQPAVVQPASDQPPVSQPAPLEPTAQMRILDEELSTPILDEAVGDRRPSSEG